jgi:hypothetical protein
MVNKMKKLMTIIMKTEVNTQRVYELYGCVNYPVYIIISI